MQNKKEPVTPAGNVIMSRKRSRISSEEEMSSKLSEGGSAEVQNGSETSIVSGSSQTAIDDLQVSNTHMPSP